MHLSLHKKLYAHNISKSGLQMAVGRREPARGASSFELAMLTFGVVAVIGLSGLLV